MASQRKALGRGLSALLGTEDLEPDQLREIDIDRIVPNANQPRKSFDINSLNDLAASLRAHGLVQPIVVRALDDGTYQIIAGERRWRAAQRAALTRLPAVVRSAHEHEALELALIENVQRENLNPVDEATAYQRLLSEFGLTQEDVAQKVGKSRASIANMLRLLKLPAEVLEWLRENRLTVGHAKALLSLEDPARILAAAQEIVSGQLSVREAESLAARVETPPSRQTRDDARVDPNVRAALADLERALGTKVTMRQRGHRGKIEIHFHSQDELDRIYSGLVAARF